MVMLYRKRPLPESSRTSSIRPAKVLKASGSSTSGERAEDVNADLDEAISKCFIGNLMIIMHDDE